MHNSDLKWLQSTSHNNETTTQLLQNYFKEWVLGVCSPLTVGAKKNDLKKFFIFYQHLNGNLDLSAWSALDTAKFLNEMERQGYKPATINRTLANLKSFASYLLENKHIIVSPVRGIRGPIQESLPASNLTDVQIHRLRKAAQKLIQCETAKYHQSFRNMVILELFLGTGLRCSELAALKVSQLVGKKFVGVKCKGNRYRDILIANRLRTLIEGYLKEYRIGHGECLFTSHDGHRLSRRSVYNVIQKIADQANAGIKDKIKVWAHLLRHVHAKRCRDKHGDCFTAKRLGHSSTRYIERYAGYTEQEEAAMVEDINT